MKRLIPMLLLAAGTAAAQSAQPICIVDGVRVPPETCFGSGALPKGKIESVEVLKGAGAVAQYGSEAANGVVTIKTKEGSMSGDPFAGVLFPPDLVMSKQNAIGLTEKQRLQISAYVLKAQQEFIPAQLKLAGEVEKLQEILKAAAPGEERAVAQLGRVLDIEREVKQAQVRLMVQVKNVLTPTQQAELNKLREQE